MDKSDQVVGITASRRLVTPQVGMEINPITGVIGRRVSGDLRCKTGDRV